MLTSPTKSVTDGEPATRAGSARACRRKRASDHALLALSVLSPNLRVVRQPIFVSLFVHG